MRWKREKAGQMRKAALIGALMLAASASASDIQQRERLAWSMLTLLSQETPLADCSQTAPVCAHLAQIDAVRKAEPALVRGDLRNLPTDRAPHLLAFARRLPEGNRAPFIDTIIIFNMAPKPMNGTVMIDRRIDVTKSLIGRCQMPSVGGLLEVQLGAYETLICAGAVAVY